MKFAHVLTAIVFLFAAGQMWAQVLSEAKRLVGPFVQGTGHWNKVPLCDFESSSGPVPAQAWYGDTHRLVFMADGSSSGIARVMEQAAAVGKYGLSIKPDSFKGIGIGVAYDGLVALVQGHTYVLSGFIKRLKPSIPEAHIYLDLWGEKLGLQAGLDTTNWQFVYGTFTATKPSNGARAVIDNDITSEGEVYFDEIALTPIEQFEPPEVTSSPKQAVARATVEGGKIVSIGVTSSGGGYASAPTVVLDGGGGTGAVAFPVMKDGSIDHIVVGNGGHGYTSNPMVLISRPVSEPALSAESSPLRKVLYLPAGRECRVALYLGVGRRYILEESADLEAWSPLENSFAAESGIKMKQLKAVGTNRYLRVSAAGQ